MIQRTIRAAAGAAVDHNHVGATDLGYTVGQYYGPKGAVTGTRAMATNECRTAPYLVRQTQSFDRIRIETTTAGGAGSLYRLGIFAHDPATGRPGAVVLDAGTVVADAVAGVQELTIAQSLPAGWYWLAVACQNHSGGPILRAFSGLSAGGDLVYQSSSGVSMSIANHYIYSAISGAFATLAATTPGGVSTAMPSIVLRAA